MARPNILMFGDPEWSRDRYAERRERYDEWRERVDGSRVVAVELGRGWRSPTVRFECQTQADELIRINPREPETPPGGIPLATGALAALEAIDAELGAGN